MSWVLMCFGYQSPRRSTTGGHRRRDGIAPVTGQNHDFPHRRAAGLPRVAYPPPPLRTLRRRPAAPSGYGLLLPTRETNRRLTPQIGKSPDSAGRSRKTRCLGDDHRARQQPPTVSRLRDDSCSRWDGVDDRPGEPRAGWTRIGDWGGRSA